jgi:aminomethyltransferase
MRETVLNAVHRSLGARLVPFAGWEMPVQYSGILNEVELVRTKAGLFDLGHMGRVRITGAGAEAFLQRLQTNDVTQIPPGGIRYALILDEQGLTQDDVLVYREPDGDGFFMVVNASNAEHDLGIMHALARSVPNARVVDQTEELGMFAIQGPAALATTQELTDLDLSSMRYYRWARGKVGGIEAGISRTGYTGEDGFELYVPRARTAELWNAFLAAGKGRGLAPAGLGARDILRLEAGMALYGHEIDRTTNPLEAGLDWAVKLTHDFVGRGALEAIQRQGGPQRRLIGFTSPGKRVPRQGYELFAGDRKLGVICSGGTSPTLGTNIGTVYVPAADAVPGTEVSFAVRDRREPATLAQLPFYKRPR